MGRNLTVLAALLLVLAIPFLLRPKEDLLAKADETLVIISPHNEAIRYEFSRAFHDYYLKKTGRTVRIDWRTVGGTSEITRFIKSEFTAAFEVAWKAKGGKWSNELGEAAQSPKTLTTDNSENAQARREFLASEFGIGIDLFFGGGAFDYKNEADAGRLVSSGVVEAHPEWFGPSAIPQTLGGEPLWDPKGRWIGACLSAFGICYNAEAYRRLGISKSPERWGDLADPKLYGQLALADPTKSGSIAKAFEMLVQEQMHRVVNEAGNQSPETLAEGWAEGLRLLQKLGANARYFTDSASKVPIDVSMGDAAAGMCIDFYGRFQAESVAKEGNPDRIRYVSPIGGTSTGADPIGLLRGAPNRALAVEFITFLFTEEAQKLWNFKVGTPGGPEKFALRRLPIEPQLYAPQFQSFMSDPGVDPYVDAQSFQYEAAWTGGLFGELRLIVRAMCIDPHDELKAAWKALIANQFPPKAMQLLEDVSFVNYAKAATEIKTMMRSSKKIDSVRLTKELSEHFRAQYREVARLAVEEGKNK